LVINVADPAKPVQIGHYQTTGRAADVSVMGILAYVVDRSVGFEVLDVSDPTKPLRVGGVPHEGGGFTTLAVTDDVIVVAIISGARVLDSLNPAAPMRVSEFSVDFPASLNVAVPLVYSPAFVPVRSVGATDLSDPAHPVRAGTLKLSEFADAFHPAGKYAYVLFGERRGVLIVEQRFLIPQPQTLAFNVPAELSLSSSPLTLSATASSGLPITFSVVSGPASIDGNELTFRIEQSGDDQFLPGSIDRTFTVLVPNLEEIVGQWISQSHPNVPNEHRGLSDDADGDGAPNVLEFIFNTAPDLAAASDGKLPIGRISESGEGEVFEVEFDLNPELPPWIQWQVEESTESSEWLWNPIPDHTVQQAANRVTVRLPVSGLSRYLRFKVIIP